jgi:hypothetical protein
MHWHPARALTPPRLTSPLSGLDMPLIMAIAVVLPAPFGPSSPTVSPWAMLKLMAFTATRSP